MEADYLRSDLSFESAEYVIGRVTYKYPTVAVGGHPVVSFTIMGPVDALSALGYYTERDSDTLGQWAMDSVAVR